MLLQTTQAWDAAKKVVDPPVGKKDPPKIDPPKTNPAADDAAKKKAAEDRAQYQAIMTKGQQLFAQRQFPEAAQQFEAALKLIPGDPTATKLLQQAQALMK